MRNDLVSVVVITYNSQDTIIETLNSIYEQTYKSLELIVSDDCSTDNTIDIVKKWIRQHGKRFIRCGISIAKKNGGVVANCNKGIRRANGDYIKEIAGDDILKKDCITECLNCMYQGEYDVVYSRLKCFGDAKMVKEMEKSLKTSYVALKSNDQKIIKEYYLKNNFIPTPSVFFKRKVFDSIGGYDCRFPFWEDAPFFMKVINKKYRVGFIDKETILYRVSSSSLGHAASNGISSYVDFKFMQSQVRYYYWMRLWVLLRNKMFKEAWEEHCRMFPQLLNLCKYCLKIYQRNR